MTTVGALCPPQATQTRQRRARPLPLFFLSQISLSFSNQDDHHTSASLGFAISLPRMGILLVDAHGGGVNDLAFSHLNKQLCIVTCGDDKLVKVTEKFLACDILSKMNLSFIINFGRV